MGKLRCGRISIRPYDARKRTYAMPVMLFAYNICQRSDNTRVGANCNSPIHCRQFALPLRAIRPPFKGNWKHRWICNVDEFCNMDEFTMWTNLQHGWILQYGINLQYGQFAFLLRAIHPLLYVDDPSPMNGICVNFVHTIETIKEDNHSPITVERWITMK